MKAISASLTVLMSVVLAATIVGESRSENFKVILAGILARDQTDQCDCLLIPGSIPIRYRLDTLGGFSLGDTVVVVADLEDVCDCGSQSIPCLPENSVHPWRDYDFGCGTLTIDTEYDCGFLVTDEYGWIAVDPQGYGEGARLQLIATLDFQCRVIAPCATSACAMEQNLTLCATPTVKSTWGRLRALSGQP